MDFLHRMNKVIDYIEANIEEDFDINEVAAIVCCSVYQFGRIFSYVVGISFTEYIRNRRMSLAALELQSGMVKVIDVAQKYGYDSPESFSRAFRQRHGISPRESFTNGAKLKMYPRLSFQISIQGVTDMEYRIEQRGIIKGVGVVKNFGKWTSNADAEKWEDRMGERWKFWDEYLDGGMDAKVAGYGLYHAPFYQMGVVHTDDNGNIVEAIGAEAGDSIHPDLTPFEIPASIWAVFSIKGTLNQNVHPLEKLTAKIFTEWLPSSGYEKSMEYEIQTYGPGNTQSDDYVSEIWIPIRKK